MVRASQVTVVVKNPPANEGDIKTWVWSLGWEDPLEEAWQPHQYSCLENTMDRGAWWTVVHRVAKNWTWLKWLSMHAFMQNRNVLTLLELILCCASKIYMYKKSWWSVRSSPLEDGLRYCGNIGATNPFKKDWIVFKKYRFLDCILRNFCLLDRDQRKVGIIITSCIYDSANDPDLGNTVYEWEKWEVIMRRYLNDFRMI